jgi:hypothetical protein
MLYMCLAEGLSLRLTLGHWRATPVGSKRQPVCGQPVEVPPCFCASHGPLTDVWGMAQRPCASVRAVFFGSVNRGTRLTMHRRAAGVRFCWRQVGLGWL